MILPVGKNLSQGSCFTLSAGCSLQINCASETHGASLNSESKFSKALDSVKEHVNQGTCQKRFSGFCPLRGYPLNGQSFCQKTLSGQGGYNPHSGLNQGVRPSYYNFQISPRTLCMISTDCFAESPVTVSFDHILYTFCSINMSRVTHQMTNQ